MRNIMKHANEDSIPEYLSEPFGEDTFPRDGEDTRAPMAERSGIRVVDTQLEDGIGIFGYYSASKRFGTAATIRALEEVGRIWAARYDAPRLGVGDISLEGGGDISGHASHETGRDVDMRPVRNNGSEGPVTWRQSKYSHQLTQELIDLLYSNGVVQVKVIGFNDPQSTGTVNWVNHDNHLHVRFYFEDQQPGFPPLSLGINNSPPVREMQRRLNNWFEKTSQPDLLILDGDFGQNTHDAALSFQNDHELTPDGRFGQQSWKASLTYIT